MSSDSDEDCYGNILQKLNSMKNKYEEDRIETTNVLNSDNPTEKTDCDVQVASSDDEDITLDIIIAKNRKRNSRSSKRNADNTTDKILPVRACRKRTKRSNENVISPTSNPEQNLTLNDSNTSVNGVSLENNNVSRGSTTVSRVRSRRGRGRRKQGTSRNSSIVSATNSDQTSSQTTNSSSHTSNISANISVSSPSRRGRGGRRRPNTNRRPSIPEWLSNYTNPPLDIPIYSIGNTFDYPDQCHNQELFSKQTDDVIVVENELENDSIDDNEELNVKVYWQNCEYVKFTIRKYQKLTQIFDFFEKREKVKRDMLLFTYNDKIIKADDTPDSIEYSIAKFIDGGIIHTSITKIVQKDNHNKPITEGIKLKFQCQNVKKHIELVTKLDDKMSTVMMMCAERLEIPLEKLKFHFDGDLLSGKRTPREMEMEGDECIDVKIVS